MYYDITQEVFSCKVYPGDSPPSFRRAQDMARGDACTVTDITMCAHNGTHVDAPAHYVRGGKTAEALELSRFAGRCAVRSFAGRICAEELQNITAPRLLIKGEREITPEEAALQNTHRSAAPPTRRVPASRPRMAAGITDIFRISWGTVR